MTAFTIHASKDGEPIEYHAEDPFSQRFLPPGFSIVCLPERDAEPVLFPPYDAAMPAHLIGLHDQREFVGNSQCIWNVDGGAAL